MSRAVKSAIGGARILSKAVCFLAIFSGFIISKSHAQTTVTYTMQDANFPTQFNSGGDFFNNGGTELGMWANSNAKQTVGWQNFTTTGAVGGTARNLQVGDVFITTVAATRAFGQIGFSLNAGGTQGSSYANNISGSRMYISTDNNAAWSVKGLSGGATSSLSYVPLQDTFKDYRFTVRITSQTTADVYLTVDGTDYRAYNLALAGSAGANISAFSIFGSDMWDGNSNENAFWKQTTSVQNSGRVELGYFAAGATSTTPGLITDGLAANSTSVTSANAVFIGGAAGSQVNLNQANTYTGQTTVNSAARLEVQNAGALGGTSNGTTVSDGGALSLYQATGGITVASEALNLAGLGVSGANGALRNTGGNNAWNGAITLGASTRINADTTGSSGSLTIGGNITGGANVVFMGAQGASGGNTGGNINVSGVIGGAGATQDGTVTALYKDGAGTLTLSGANNYTGDTRIALGNLTVSGSGTLGTGSDIFIGSGGSLSVNVNTTVASLQEWGTGNAGTVALGTGSTLTVNGADKGTMFQNSISGAGGLTMAGSGTSSLSLYGTQGYTGATTVSGGRISSGVALASSGIAISGGTFETTAADIVANTSAVNMSAGTYALGGNDTVASLTISGGLLSSANASTLTAATYALQGGTVSANLGAGTVNASSGTTLLSGTSAAANVNVAGGLLSLVSADRLANSAAVAVSSGELAVGANDTVGSLSTTGGTVSGSGTLTAATYALNGGTVSGNLGAGTVNTSSGTTLLSGTSAAANVNVQGGLLTLASVNRLADTAAVAVSSGELAMGGNDTIGSLSTTGGTVSGSGILTAATYALNGGTVSVNLGAGTVNTSSGTTLLSGTSAAANVNVQGGTLNTSSANRLADGAAVAVSSGTLGVGGNDTVGSLVASGTGAVTVASGTTLTANGNSSITGSARATGGTVAVANNSLLTLANSSTTTTSDLSIGSGSTLAGTGGTSGQIKGSGLLSPGNSPGILTSGSVDLTGGIDFAFEFTAAGAPTYSLAGNSRNDLLHLTSGSTPFSGSFSTGNTVSFYFNDAGLGASLASGTPTTYLGGFFVDAQNFDIAGLLSSASLQYFIAAANGTTSFNGVNYNLMSNEVASGIILSNVNQSGADFTTGTVDGTVLSVVAVPEPSSASLLLAGIGSLLVLRRFRKNA
jgi:hypothetical protein